MRFEDSICEVLVMLVVSDVVRYRSRCVFSAADVARISKLQVSGLLSRKGAFVALSSAAGIFTVGNAEKAKDRLAKNRVLCVKEVLYVVNKVLRKAKETKRVSFLEAVLLKVAAGCRRTTDSVEATKTAQVANQAKVAEEKKATEKATAEKVVRDWAKVAREKHIVIYTSYFASKEVAALDTANYDLLSIASRARDGFEGGSVWQLKPNSECWDAKKAEDWTSYTKAYMEQLAKLDPRDVLYEIFRTRGTKTPVLLCWEGRGKFCHRHLVAKWLRSFGFVVRELGEGSNTPSYTTTRKAKAKSETPAQENARHEAPEGYHWVLLEGCKRTYILERIEDTVQEAEPEEEDRDRKPCEFTENEEDMYPSSSAYRTDPFVDYDNEDYVA